ncbi:hypothetical protein D3C87_1043190 [compost metagenome]
MWVVCYEVKGGKTHYNEFKSEEEAIDCYIADKEYYVQEWGEGNFKISVAKVIKRFE